MEPFHQLRISSMDADDIIAELKAIGLTVTQRSESWLRSKHPSFRDLICESDGLRTVLSIGSDSSDTAHTLIVYGNMLDDALRKVVREHFEKLGAEWGYFDD